MEHLDLHDAVLAGHSMGTGEVTRYLSAYGSARVAKGVLVSPIPPFLLQTSDNPDGVPQSLFDGFVQAAQSDMPAWMKGFLDSFYNFDTLRGTLVSDQAYQASWNLAVTASATAAVACPYRRSTTTTKGDTMSNHFSADKLKFPGDDRRLDLTDVFVFGSSADPDKTVIIIDSNPTSAPPPIPAPTTGPEFHPDAVYRVNIDTDGDNQADIAFTFTFSPFENGRQTGTAWYATGSQAQQPEPAGEQLTASLPVSFDGTPRPVQAGAVRMSAALRSDPFFADVEGALHGFQWSGHDDFADNNVDSIALEVPNDMLGAGPVIGVWAAISRRRDGKLEQMDRGGNPTINPFINPDGEKNLFNSRQPADDVANYLGPWSKILENGGYSPEEAKVAALQVLPDILHYDRREPATYPNGRVPTDDVYSMRFAWLSHGKIPPTGLKPHDDLLAQFPYLGVPNPPKSSS
jgi:hypothetical protein